jgi:hypothetical protein
VSRDGNSVETRYNEQHKRDTCVVRPDNFRTATKTFAGIFAHSFAAGDHVKLFCEYDDTDEDGVFDIEDACPNSPKFARGRVDENGCTRSQADPDHDGVCTNEPAASQVWCATGSDNCDFAFNPLQTATKSSTVGDACNLGAFLSRLPVASLPPHLLLLLPQTAALLLVRMVVTPSLLVAPTLAAGLHSCARHRTRMV